LNSLSKKKKNPLNKWGVLKAQELQLGVKKTTSEALDILPDSKRPLPFQGIRNDIMSFPVNPTKQATLYHK
jgi:hypothetical protein